MKASFKTHSDQIYFTHAFTATCSTHLSQSKSKVHLSYYYYYYYCCNLNPIQSDEMYFLILVGKLSCFILFLICAV